MLWRPSLRDVPALLKDAFVRLFRSRDDRRPILDEPPDGTFVHADGRPYEWEERDRIEG